MTQYEPAAMPSQLNVPLDDGATAGNGGRGGPPILTFYLRVLSRWKWAIAGVVAACLMLGIVVTMLTKPQYQAVTVIEIAREASHVIDIKDVEPQATAVDQEFYETQYGLLKSRSLSEDVARQLNLAADNHFFEMYGVKVAGLPNIARGSASALAQARAKRVELAGRILLDNLAIRPARLSRLVEIRFSSPEAQFAQRVANTWAEQFVRSNLDRRYNATSYARDFLEKRLEQTRRRLEDSERNLVAYAGEQGIIQIGGESGDTGKVQQAPQSLAGQEITNLNQELARAVADRIAVEGEYRQAQAGQTVQPDINNATLASLRSRRADVSADLARMLTQFEPSYPPASALRSQLAELDKSIAREESRVRSSVASRYREAQNRENLLTARVDQLKGSLLDLRRRSIQYNIYQRDVDTNRALYDGLLQRYKEIGVAGGVGTNNVSIVDGAKIPEAPYKPRPLINMLIALLAGLGLGVVLSFALEQIDEGVSDADMVERAIGVPLLGVSPLVREGGSSERLLDPKSELTEAYATIRTSLSFTTPAGVPRTMSITSTRPSEGKTTSSYAIALALARTGKKVLLIDADLRSPSLHHLFHISNKAGLSTILSGNKTIAEVAHETQLLTVVPAGPRPPNPAELLTGNNLRHFLDRALEQYDQVIFDSPPVMGLADAPLLANTVEAVVFVVEARKTKARFARVALERLHKAHAHIVGVVLTKYDPRRNFLGYSYEYGYGYGRVDQTES